MNLSIIIVNWNSVGCLNKCLESIYKETTGLDFEVIVVDNASFDGSEKLIEGKFAKTKFIQSAKNLGFAGANNLGFQHSSGESVLFLNPDTEIIGTAINDLYTNLNSVQEVGAVGGKLFNSDGSVQISCIQVFPTILNQIFDSKLLQFQYPMLKMWGIKPLFHDGDIPEEIDAISGACLMVRRAVFEKVGLFSTDYFMYSEDVDLCYKIRQAGLKVYYVGKAKVIHHGGSSSREHPVDSLEDVLMRESIFRFLSKTRGRFYASLYRISLLAVSVTRLWIALALVPAGKLLRIDRKLSQVTKKWSKLVRWSLGMEHWARVLNANGQSAIPGRPASRKSFL